MERSIDNGSTVPKKRNMRRRRDPKEGNGTANEVEITTGKDELDSRRGRGPREEENPQIATPTGDIEGGSRRAKSHTRPKAHARVVTVLGEDLEEGEIPMMDVTDMVNLSFGDPCDGHYDSSRVNWEYTSDRKGGHLLFVENPKTGFLVPVSADGMSRTSDNVSAGMEEIGGDDEESSPLLGGPSPAVGLQREQDANAGSMSLQFVYLFFQGVLAGFSLSTLYAVSQASSDESLLTDFQPRASESRRFFMLISSLSLVGALDCTLSAMGLLRSAHSQNPSASAHSNKHRRTRRGSTADAAADTTSTRHVIMAGLTLETLLVLLSILVLGLYLVCFLVVMAMGSVVVLISEKNGYNRNEDGVEGVDDDALWPPFALDDENFSDRFDWWKKLVSLRVALAFLGWVGSCLMVLIGHWMGERRDEHAKSLWGIINALRSRIAELQGDAYTSLTVNDLKHLLAVQQLGAQRTQEAIATLEDDENDGERSG